MHTLESLSDDLRMMGIAPSDTLVVHSSLKSIGAVAGGAETVLQALEDAVADGLLVFPTLTYHLNAANPDYFPAETAGIVGTLSELFRKRPGVLRSWHPTHSVAAKGRDAAEFVAGHEKFNSPCAPASPWGRLLERNAKVLFIGTGIGCNTFLHGIEERAQAPNILTCHEELLYVHLPDGRRLEVPSRRHIEAPEHSQFYKKLEGLFENGGALRRGNFGDAACHLLFCRPAGERTLAWLRREPDLFTHSELPND